MKVNRRRRLEAKFIFRRVLLIVVALGILGGGAWFAYGALIADKLPQNTDAAGNIFDTGPAIDDEPDSEPVVSRPQSSEPAFTAPDTAEPVSALETWELLLVNSDNPLPEGYAPELEVITENFRVDARIADNVKRMFAKALEDGISLMICSAYRSFETQQTNFDNKKRELMQNGSTEEDAFAVTASIIAVPGTSEHHTGLAMDIVTPSYQMLDSGFANTPAFGWLDKNAHLYGFVLRYPEDKQDITKIIYEPWHYRYVGEEHAARMKANGQCLEEYLGFEAPVDTETPAAP